MTRPDTLLFALQRADASRPRITCYDDTDGPSRGERIELSARVLSNWVAKAANALQEEFDVELPDYELQGIKTFSALAQKIDKRR